tara:strand:+ start:150 stop:1481 length:1332 start_codon:yes stop_codon:yes gene_type:complete
MNNWKLRATYQGDNTMDFVEVNGYLASPATSDIQMKTVPFGDKFPNALRTSASDDHGPVSNQVPGICNGTFTHTGAGSATVSATTLSGEGTGATFTYTFLADGTLSTIVAASGGGGYLVGDKLRITTSASHGSQVIEFRLVDGSNATTRLMRLIHDRALPMPFPVHRAKVNEAATHTFQVFDYRSSQVFPKPQDKLLDKFPNAAAAYSLRRVRSAYLGPCIRVRRQDNDEKDFYFDGQGNLDTAALLDFCTDQAGFVAKWYDQSGNGKDAIQATSGHQPRIVNGNNTTVTQDGYVAMVFDGINDNLANSTLTDELDNSDFLVSAVYGDDLVMGITSSTPRLYLQDSTFSYNTLSTISYAAQTGHKLLSFQVVGATQEVFANGSSLGTATQAQVAFTPSAFNLNIAGAGYGSGRMQEVVVYASDQSANRAAIETHMNNYWNIYS